MVRSSILEQSRWTGADFGVKSVTCRWLLVRWFNGGCDVGICQMTLVYAICCIEDGDDFVFVIRDGWLLFVVLDLLDDFDIEVIHANLSNKRFRFLDVGMNSSSSSADDLLPRFYFPFPVFVSCDIVYNQAYSVRNLLATKRFRIQIYTLQGT